MILREHFEYMCHLKALIFVKHGKYTLHLIDALQTIELVLDSLIVFAYPWTTFTFIMGIEVYAQNQFLIACWCYMDQKPYSISIDWQISWFSFPIMV